MMDQAMESAMADPEVVAKTGEGDAAMEAGDFDRAYEIYAEAKRLRDQLLPAMEGPGDMVFSKEGEGTGKSPPQHGRRSVHERTSILVSTPARRKQPEGAPTRKEEVEARIRARNEGVGR